MKHNAICKYCGKAIRPLHLNKGGRGVFFYVHEGMEVDCDKSFPLDRRPQASPMTEEDVIDKILTKYDEM